MTNFFIKTAIRANFKLTGRERINGRIRRYSTHYLELAKRIDGAQGAKPVLVPRMVGVDEDMRTWSFFMVLEHNTIVGRMMTSLIERLARGETPEGDLEIKESVRPSSDAGGEQVEAFRACCENHLLVVSGLEKLKDTPVKAHPMFGDFDAHCWHAMFAFHLRIHQKQAAYVVAQLAANPGGLLNPG